MMKLMPAAPSQQTELPPTGPPPGSGGPGDRGGPRWVHRFVVLAMAVTLLLLGATAGLLLGPSGSPAPAGAVDVGFAQDMSVHHQQAVEMAGWERDHTTDPVLHQLAFDIESTQTQQIGQLQGWLALWGAATLPVGGHMAWMGAMMGDGGVATMPGMASDSELKALRAATGPALDVLFLQLMLRHHQGGSSMLQYAAEHAELTEVRNLAGQMLSSQTAEAGYLTQLLTARGGKALPL